MRMTTVSSGRITTQALTSGVPSAARATVGTTERKREPERQPAADGGRTDHEGPAIQTTIG